MSVSSYVSSFKLKQAGKFRRIPEFLEYRDYITDYLYCQYGITEILEIIVDNTVSIDILKEVETKLDTGYWFSKRTLFDR